MPLIDMPLEKLYEYKGVNPKPSDFDMYWERALAEMNAVDPKVELVPALFKAPDYAEVFDLYFTGVGGSRVYARYLRPKGKKNCPAIFCFHGYSGAFYDYSSMLGYVAAGFCMVALDCRGQGGKSEDLTPRKGNTHHGQIIRGLEDEPDKLYFRDMYLDTAQLVKIVCSFDEVDGTRLGCKGGSQGGGLTYACASLVPEMKVACAHFPFLSDYKRVWNMDLDACAYAELREFFRHTDPRHLREEEFFTKLGYIDIQHLAPRIKAKMYMFTGLMDNICPPSTQFAAYNAIKGDKEVFIYPDFGHENMPGSDDIVFEIMCEALL